MTSSTLPPSYFCIENAGEVDPLALSLLGASTKRDDDTKIGMFGSGFKYALAVLLRTGHTIHVFRGTTPIRVGTVTKQLRGKSFSVITIDGESTSITVDTGPQWGIPDAIREIWTNALDEGHAARAQAPLAQGRPGTTRIFIYLSPETMEKGRKEIGKTLIEEHIHVKFKCADQTRAMQEAFLETIFTLLGETF